jgi:hypothetical protein
MRPTVLPLLALLCCAGCIDNSRNAWRPPAPGETVAGEQRPDELRPRSVIVLVAPVAIGPLKETWPEARTGFAFDLAERIDVLGRKADADGRAGERLPVSDSADWKAPVADARGAHYVVLTTIIDALARDGQVTSEGRQVAASATAEMRVLDAEGNIVFKKTGRGDWEGVLSPKLIGPAAQPRHKAAWLACSNLTGALLDFLEKRNEAPGAAPTPQSGALVEVEVASEPVGADVLIDGIFRGNTPCTLKLPARPLTLRLERQGRQPWERKLTPEPGMKLKPALEALAARP